MLCSLLISKSVSSLFFSALLSKRGMLTLCTDSIRFILYVVLLNELYCIFYIIFAVKYNFAFGGEYRLCLQ